MQHQMQLHKPVLFRRPDAMHGCLNGNSVCRAMRSSKCIRLSMHNVWPTGTYNATIRAPCCLDTESVCRLECITAPGAHMPPPGCLRSGCGRCAASCGACRCQPPRPLRTSPGSAHAPTPSFYATARWEQLPPEHGASASAPQKRAGRVCQRGGVLLPRSRI